VDAAAQLPRRLSLDVAAPHRVLLAEAAHSLHATADPPGSRVDGRSGGPAR
jgi:hypothetical protein